MPVPVYDDVDEIPRDLITKHFPCGNLNVKIENETETACNISVEGNQRLYFGNALAGPAVTGRLKLKHLFPRQGIIISEEWNSLNKVTTSCLFSDVLVPGMSTKFEAVLNPITAQRNFKIKNCVKQANLAANVNVEVEGQRSLHVVDMMVQHRGLWCGAQIGTSLDFISSHVQLNKVDYCLGFTAPDWSIIGKIFNGTKYKATVYQKLTENCAMAVDLSWIYDTQHINYQAAVHYNLNHNNNFFKLRVTNESILSIAYSFLMDRVRITLGSQIDISNMATGTHSFGIGLEFNPEEMYRWCPDETTCCPAGGIAVLDAVEDVVQEEVDEIHRII